MVPFVSAQFASPRDTAQGARRPPAGCCHRQGILGAQLTKAKEKAQGTAAEPRHRSIDYAGKRPFTFWCTTGGCLVLSQLLPVVHRHHSSAHQHTMKSPSGG